MPGERPESAPDRGLKRIAPLVARAPPPAAVLMLGDMEKGVPVCATQVNDVDQRPITSSTHLEESPRNALPLPTGIS